MSAALDLRSKEEKDAELDKRIEALRKKNEALIKRYQEIEEDRKKAEQEGIAVTALRRGRPPDAEPERRWVDKDLSVTLQEKRSAKDKKAAAAPKRGRRAPRSPRGGGADPPADPFWEGGDGGARGRRSRGRGAPVAATGGGDAGPDRKSKEWEERRRQNIEKMNEEMEKIAEYERNQRDGLHEKNPVRNFLDDPRRSGPFQEADRKEGSRRHVRNWGGPDFDKVKAGLEREKSWQGPGRTSGRRSAPKPGLSLDMTMTGRERAEYVRWKKEREQIDRERLARHRKPTGQWRREWDAEKSDSMFKEASATSGPEEPRRPPPKPPTFGEFLAPRRGPRRRKTRAAPSAPYSMHDDRWEEKEPAASDETEPREGEQPQSGAPPEPPRSAEEDEDQWEDVSEEEEEEGSSGSASPAEAPRSASPRAAAPPGPRAGGAAPCPPSPSSPRPLRDWAEEVELASPRRGFWGGGGPLGGPTFPETAAETPGLSPTELPDPPQGVQPPDEPPQDEETTPENGGTRGGAEATPGAVEITDFERVRFRKNSPSPSGR